MEGAGLDNQQHTNNIAIEQLQVKDNYTRLSDVIEVGSAYKGNNLLTIIENAKAGLYPKDSIIVMFDQTRFSRTDFLDSANKMKELLDTGIKVHYSSSNETLTSDKLQDFGGFISMLAKAEAANKESKSRSDRTLASYAKKIANNEIVAVGALPNWLRKLYDTSGSKPKIIGFEVIPERKKVIETIFEKYILGQGATTITAWLNTNVAPWPEFDGRRVDKSNRVWRESYISKILVNPAIIGERIFNVGRENETRVENYYPAAVDNQKWYQAQEIRKNRPKGTTGGYIYPVNIFSGLSFCGYCGARCGVQNFNTGRRSALRCSAYAKKEVSSDICAGGTSPARFLEQVIIEFCSDQINFDAIFKQEMTDVSSLKVQYAVLEQQIFKLTNKLTKVEDLYLEDEISKGRYIERKNEFESKLRADKTQLDNLKVKIAANTHVKTTNEFEFAKLLDLLKGNEIPNELRLKIRDLLPKFIDKITVFRYGDWLSPKKFQQAKDLLGQQSNNDIIEHMEQRTIKSRAIIIYGMHFKNGYFRAIWFDAKKKTWFSKTDNAGVLHESNTNIT
jgi:hypothetical protein